MILASGPVRQLGVDPALAQIRFDHGEKPAGAWAGRRHLVLDGEPAFELSYWCGTCPALFERLEGANHTVSLEDLADRLRSGVDSVDGAIVAPFGHLLAAGSYLPLLLEVRPQLVRPAESRDYFAHEQVATWGINAFWGLPEYPRTAYYRTFETTVNADAHLYEFVVPMVPPSWNERDRVAAFRTLLGKTSMPTAVAVSTLDICQPATDHDGSDYYEHWALSHFLLDGHHKFEAAAEAQRPLRLLALVTIDGSLARPQDVEHLIAVRSRDAAQRVPGK